MRTLLEFRWIMGILLWSMLREPGPGSSTTHERSKRYWGGRSPGSSRCNLRHRSWRRGSRRATGSSLTGVFTHELAKGIILIPLLLQRGQRLVRNRRMVLGLDCGGNCALCYGHQSFSRCRICRWRSHSQRSMLFVRLPRFVLLRMRACLEAAISASSLRVSASSSSSTCFCNALILLVHSARDASDFGGMPIVLRRSIVHE